MDLETESNQRSGGTRTVCDLELRQVTQVVNQQDWDSVLEPGDIVMCRTSGHWLSKTISNLDGYWTHSTIYVGGGMVAHASAGGLGIVPLSGLAGHYEDCMGFARPKLTDDKRTAAAVWARKQSREGGPYSGYDLGLAFALLARARWRAAINRLPFLESMEEAVAIKPEGLEAIGGDGGATCSGFVYTAYKESGSKLNIRPAPGITLSADGRLTVADRHDGDKSLDSYLETVDAEALERLEMPSRDDLKQWMMVGGIVRSAMVASADHVLAADDDQAIPVEQGVTPSDLWCSPDVDVRGFLSSAYMTHAHTQSADCGEPQT